MHEINLTLLCENTARGRSILGEHGLAWWIDTGTHRVLFDAGQGLALLNNAAVLGIDLTQADAVVLSHGHYDHTGGLEKALAEAPGATLFLHPDAVAKKTMAGDTKGAAQHISSPYVENEEFRHDERKVVVSREPVEVVPGVWSTGEVPRTNSFEDTGGPFFLDDAATKPDPLLDDQALYFPTREGVVVVLGCAHAGVVNTLAWVAKLTGRDKIHTLVGGMHLEKANPQRLAETMTALRDFGIQRLGPVHCTGWVAIAEFQREFPAAYFPSYVGTRLSWTREA